MGFASRRFTGPLVLVIFLLGAAPASGPALTAVAATAGHPAALHLRAIRTVTADNRTAVQTLEAAGEKRLVRTCRDGFCTGIWDDGGTVSAFGINGVPLPDDDLDSARERTLAAIYSTAFAEPGFTGTVRALEPQAGRTRWLVQARGGSPMIAVTEADGTLVAISGPSGEEPAAVYAATAANGARMYAGVPIAQAEAVAGTLDPPPRTGTTVEAPATLAYAGPLPIVPCAVEGKAARCLLDTGSNPSGVTLEFAELLGAEPHGEITISGLGEYVTGAIDGVPVRLGNATISPLALAVVPTNRGIGFDVVLGSDALAELRLTFDTRSHTVRIGTASGSPPDRIVPLHFRHGVPLVDAVLNGFMLPLLLDTGDDGMLSIGYDTYRLHTDLFSPGKNVPVAGLAGGADALAGTIAQAAIGPIELGPAAIRAVRAEHLGHAGFGLAVRCTTMTLDLHAAWLACSR